MSKGNRSGVGTNLQRIERMTDEIPVFIEKEVGDNCLNCKFFASWYDIFYQEDPEEPDDCGECYYWYDEYNGYGLQKCQKWEKYK